MVALDALAKNDTNLIIQANAAINAGIKSGKINPIFVSFLVQNGARQLYSNSTISLRAVSHTIERFGSFVTAGAIGVNVISKFSRNDLSNREKVAYSGIYGMAIYGTTFLNPLAGFLTGVTYGALGGSEGIRNKTTSLFKAAKKMPEKLGTSLIDSFYSLGTDLELNLNE